MSSPSESDERATSLSGFQRWFHGRVIRPTACGKAPATEQLVEDASLRPVEEVVLPSATLSPDERMAIYGEMYWLRIREALVADYPAVAALLGEDELDRFVREYLTKFPSMSFTLDHTGNDVPAFFRETLRFGRAPLLADVARLERGINRSFNAESSDVLSPEVVSQVPVELWPELRFRMAAAVFLLSFDHPVNAIVSAVHDERALPSLDREATWVLVWRRDFVVWRQELTRPMFAVLQALARGETIADAVSAAQDVWSRPDQELESELFGWFADWLREGLFSAIVLPSDHPRA